MNKKETLREETTKKTTVKKETKPAAAKTTAKPRAIREKAAKTGKVVTLAHGVGRRKTSVARAWLKKGSGAILVNGKDVNGYFETDFNRAEAVVPFTLIPAAQNFDVEVNVQGGGLGSQAGAMKLAIARAFVKSDETLRPLLRSNNLLTVDSRVKERKKYGQKAARRKFQFVKR